MADPKGPADFGQGFPRVARLAIASLLLLVGRDWCLARFLQNSSIRTYQEEGVANLWER
jgi:hypothetical protein